MAVVDTDRAALGRAVEALIECASGELSYVVVATHEIAGLGEELCAVSRDVIRFEANQLVLDLPRGTFNELPPLANGDWPASPANATAA